MLPLIPWCLSGRSFSLVLFIVSLHIFAAFTVHTVHIDAALSIDEAQESDDSRDICIVHKFAQLHDASYCYVNFVWWGEFCEYSVHFVAN
uniref:Uncharacterized protein n=1 Tax=Rhipicephalus pulchellus TaxID=72859 RepID=L7LYX5_RHIPC